jgi:RNA polymerase sigma factor (sigma-70 family)
MPDDALPPFDLAGCLDRVRRNDQTGRARTGRAPHPLVIRIVRSHLPRRVAEEDLAQEVFLKMFSRLAQYQGAVPFPHWVSRIAVTTCIDHLRAQKRRPEFRWADLSENEAEVLDAVMTNERCAGQRCHGGARVRAQAAQRSSNRTTSSSSGCLDLEQKTIAEISQR